MSKLKPCPFCGSRAYIQKAPYPNLGVTYWIVGCTNGVDEEGHDNCIVFDMADTVFWTREQAAEAWNKRIHPEGKKTAGMTGG